jgi:hypothetical protein
MSPRERAEAAQAAVAEEREACAQLAFDRMAMVTAAAIRARGYK